MGLPYQFIKSMQGTRAILQNLELEASVSYVDGTPLKWSANGKLTVINTNTDRVNFVLNGNATTSALGSLENLAANPPQLNTIGNGYNSTMGPGGNQSVQQLGGFADVIPACYGHGIWRVTFVPVLNNLVSGATGSPTSITLTSPNTYSANAFQGGTLYCKSLNQQVRITASSSVSGPGTITLTINSPLGQPGATINADGLVFSATPLGPSLSSIKFDTSVSSSVALSGYIPSQLGVGSADYSGGFLTVQDVDIQNGYVFVIFQ